MFARICNNGESMNNLEKQMAYLPKMLGIFGMIGFAICLTVLFFNAFTRTLELWQLNAVFYYAIGYWFGRLKIITGETGKNPKQ